MESQSTLSIMKGPEMILCRKDEPLLLHRIFEHSLRAIDSINNNTEKIPVIHGITLREGTPEIIFNGTKQPLRKINEQANQLARSIQRTVTAKQNADGDMVIAVDMPASPQLIITLLAIWKIGAAYLPLDAEFPNRRVQHVIKESRPSLVIVESADTGSRFDGAIVKTFKELQFDGENLSIENLNDETNWTKCIKDEEKIAIILYTSGSTGVPKGVRLSHLVALNRLKWQWNIFPYSDTENVCVFKTALTFVDAVPEMWSPLLWGRSLLILTKAQFIDIENFVNTMDKYKIERLEVVPSMLRSILLYIEMVAKHDSLQASKHLSSLRFCVSSSETLHPSLAQKFYQLFNSKNHTLLNYYGSTEGMADALFHIVTEAESQKEKIPLGVALNNTSVYILDKKFQPVPVGQVGEIYTSGLNTASGYVNGREPHRFMDNPFTTDPAFKKMYRTGDYGRMENGFIYYEGRIDSQIKVRGHKVDLSEVEAAIEKVKIVDKFVTLCYKAGTIDQALLAFVTCKETTAKAKDVENGLQALLAPYMMPQVIVVSHMPLLNNGKVDRQSLLKKYEEKCKPDLRKKSNFDYSGISDCYKPKAKALFKTIARVLMQSLKEKITAKSSFYNLGGNSLNSISVVTKLRDLGFVISIGDFISSNNLLEIILKMKEEEPALTGESLQDLSKIPQGKYSIQMLDESLKNDTIHIITESFYAKSGLADWIGPEIYKEDYIELVLAFWEHLLAHQLSYAVKNNQGQTLAICLNFDSNNEPEIEVKSNLIIIFEFLESLERPTKEFLPKGLNQLMYSFMMGTAPFVTPQQNIELVQLMEAENIQLARSKGFSAILTTDTSPLTQQLSVDVFDYKVLKTCQINKYVASNGSKPFETAPDTEWCVVSWKPLN